MDFIEEFNANTGTATSIKKSYSSPMVFPKVFKQVEIKSIGDNACQFGSATVIDFKQTRITVIGSLAFANCPLTEIILPDTLKVISINAFLQTTFPTLFIPASVIDINPYAFNQVFSCVWYEVEKGNTIYSSKNGFIMDATQTSILHSPVNLSRQEDMPAHTGIGAWALCLTKLTRYTAENTLRSLSDGAFYFTNRLLYLDLSNAQLTSLPSCLIESSSVKTLILPKSITKLRELNFGSKIYFPMLIIPATCTEIEKNAFNCQSNAKYLQIVYFGSTDFSTISMFGPSLTNVRVYVTPYYTQEYFGNIKVFRNWINEPATFQKRCLPSSKSLFISMFVLFN